MSLVSVVIPCRNEERFIKATVESILSSNHPNLEVLVVDGMSTDGTRGILEDLRNYDDRVRILDNPKQLTPFAFNIGVRNARGEYVQIVGARNVLDPEYIPILLAAMEGRPEIGCVGGRYEHVYETPESRYISLAMASKFGVGAGNYRTMHQNTEVDTVGIPLYRASIFKEVGMFDERLTRNQDDDFNFRVRQHGLRIFYIHAALATYVVRGSYQKVFKQYFQYGYFKVFVNTKHRALTSVRQLAPAAFVALWVLGLPLSLKFAAIQKLLSFTAFAYIVIGLIAAGHGLSVGDRLKVLITCCILHWAYGLGYWQGIFDFLVLRRDPRSEFQRQTT